MFFDMPANRTVDFKGNTSVSIKTTGSEKSHFTVILSCMADGTKLKPAVVFKRKTMQKEKFPSDILVMVQTKGWVDETILMEWLEKVWFKQPGALLNPNSLLVWDMFRVQANLYKSATFGSGLNWLLYKGGCLIKVKSKLPPWKKTRSTHQSLVVSRTLIQISDNKVWTWY